MVFLLSSPRSGSTLLRVMLAGHPEIFAPPELHLLSYENMGERRRDLGLSYLGEGLQRALVELQGLDAGTSQALVDEWERDDLGVQGIYEHLQSLAQGRIFVDKTPAYASKLEVLERSEKLFPDARYVALVRHPHAAIESFLRMRMDQLAGAGDFDRFDIAENIWTIANQNILNFFASLDPTRCKLVRYEDLVRDPRSTMVDLCEFLEVDFDEAVLTPYEGARMTDGVHATSAGVNDPNFLRHDRIEPELGEAWRQVNLARPLGAAARDIAVRLNYDVPSQGVLPPQEVLSPSVQTPPGESSVSVRDLNVRLCSWGPADGPLVFCLHGILEQAGVWEPLAIHLARQGYRVVAPDQRGHGLSGHIGLSDSYQFIDFVADADILTQGLTSQPLTLVGHSFGAVVAGTLAAARPDRIKALVLVEPALPPQRSHVADRLKTQLDDLTSYTPHATIVNIAQATHILRATNRSLSQDLAMHLAVRSTEPCEGGLRWTWDPRLLSRASNNAFSTDRSGFLTLLGSIIAPVRILFGEESLAETEVESTMRAALPRAQALRVPGGSHLHLDSPETVANIIVEAASAHRHRGIF